MKGKKIDSIDLYIAQFPGVRNILENIRKTIKESAPDADEAIKYSIPTFILWGTNLVHFGAYAVHIGFYPTPGAIRAFSKKLETYQTAKGSIRFPLERAIPYGLIKKIVKYRVKEVLKKRKARN